MAKNIRRMFAIFMVVCMFASALPLQALAADGDSTTSEPIKVDVKVQTSAGEVDGTKTTTTTTSTTESGSTTTTVTVTEAKNSETTGDPASSTVKTDVEYKETKTESVTTNTNGDQTAKSETVKGEETVTETTTTTETSTELVKEGEPETKTEEVEAGSLSSTVGQGDKVVTAAPSTEGMDIPQVGDKESETFEDTDPDYVSNKDNPVVTENEDGSVTTTTTSTTTTVDTIVETTVTDVEVTDRELITGGLTTESKAELGEDEVGEIVSVDGVTTNVKWSQVDASTDAGKALIELAKKILNNQEIGEVSEADKAVAEALAAEAKKEDGNAEVKALLGIEAETEEETINASITEVTLNVGEKVDDHEANADESDGNDVYHAQMQFEVSITKSWTDTPIVTIMQNGKPIATEYLTFWNPSVKNEGEGNYTVEIKNLQLQEGEVSLDIKLNNIDELTTEKVFVATVDRTVTVPVKDDTKPEDANTQVGAPDSNTNTTPDINGGNLWGGTQTITVPGSNATVTVKMNGSNELVISSNETIYMDTIVVNTPNGPVTYNVPDGKLVANADYKVYEDYDNKDNLVMPEIPELVDGKITGGQTTIILHKANLDETAKQTIKGKVGSAVINGQVYPCDFNGSHFDIDVGTTQNTIPANSKITLVFGDYTWQVTADLKQGSPSYLNCKGTNNYDVNTYGLGVSFGGSGEIVTKEETKTVKDGKLATSEIKQSVSLNMGMSFNFKVNEATVKTTTQTNEYEKTTKVTETIVETVRQWNSSFKEETPVEDPTTPGGEEPQQHQPWNRPRNQRLANDGIEIPEEPVPLAAPVITGDDTGLWIAFALMVAFCMAAINLFDKKHTHETF